MYAYLGRLFGGGWAFFMYSPIHELGRSAAMPYNLGSGLRGPWNAATPHQPHTSRPYLPQVQDLEVFTPSLTPLVSEIIVP